MSILLSILTVVLIVISIFLILVVLAQKAKTDGGVGGALGSGMTEATFGADTTNVLSKLTINLAIGFFVLSFVLYLGHIYLRKHPTTSGDALPAMSAPATTHPAPAPAPATPKKP